MAMRQRMLSSAYQLKLADVKKFIVTAPTFRSGVYAANGIVIVA